MSIVGTYMCPDNINLSVLTIEQNKPLDTHDQMVGIL